MERKPSEIISDFIDLVERSHSEYFDSKSAVESYDEKTLSWVHEIENTDKCEERSKISTAWHNERKERRKFKNNMCLYEKVHKFSCEDLNKGTIKRLKALLQKQIETEEYIESDKTDKVLKSKKKIEVSDDRS